MIALLLVTLLCQADIEVDPHSAFSDRPWFKSLAEDARQARQQAISRINDALQARYEDAGRVHLRFVDLTEEGARRHPAGTRAFRTTRKEGDQQIEFYLEYFANGQAKLGEEVLHEMVHAVMREQMDEDSYTSLPEWLREGLAVHVSGQTQAGAAYVLSTQRGDDPLAFLQPLDSQKHSFDDYPRDGLAIDCIARSKAGALPAFYDALVRKRLAWKDAIHEATGLEWEAFRAAALAHAKGVLAPLVEGYAEFLAVHALFTQDKKARQAQEALQAFIEKYPAGVWAATARYLLARAQLILRNKDCAHQTLRLYLESDVGKAAYEDDAWYWQAEMDFEDGLWRGSSEEYGRVIREYPASEARLPDAHARRVECFLKLGLRDEAQAEFATLSRLYPDNAATKRAEAALKK